MEKNEEKSHILAMGKSYGALSRNNGVSSPLSVLSPRRVIYCVHGKPSAGCCTVLEGEIIDINPDDDDISTHAKENTNTTALNVVISQMYEISGNFYPSSLPTWPLAQQ